MQHKQNEQEMCVYSLQCVYRMSPRDQRTSVDHSINAIQSIQPIQSIQSIQSTHSIHSIHSIQSILSSHLSGPFIPVQHKQDGSGGRTDSARHHCIGINDEGLGEACIPGMDVMVCFANFNQNYEDAIMVSKGAAERGMFQSRVVLRLVLTRIGIKGMTMC